MKCLKNFQLLEEEGVLSATTAEREPHFFFLSLSLVALRKFLPVVYTRSTEQNIIIFYTGVRGQMTVG